MFSQLGPALRKTGCPWKPVICMCFTYSEFHNTINFPTWYFTYVLSTLHYHKCLCLTSDLPQIHYYITTMEYKIYTTLLPFQKHWNYKQANCCQIWWAKFRLYACHKCLSLMKQFVMDETIYHGFTMDEKICHVCIFWV